MSSSFESEPPVGRLVTGRTAACRRGARRRVAVALDVGLVLAAWSSAAQAFTLKFTGPSNAPEMVFNNQMKERPRGGTSRATPLPR